MTITCLLSDTEHDAGLCVFADDILGKLTFTNGKEAKEQITDNDDTLVEVPEASVLYQNADKQELVPGPLPKEFMKAITEDTGIRGKITKDAGHLRGDTAGMVLTTRKGS